MVPVATSIRGFLVGAAITGAFIVACAKQGLSLPGPAVWTPDTTLIYGATAGLAYSLIFAGIHFILFYARVGMRAAYAANGAIACMIVFGVWLGGDKLMEMAEQGVAIVTFIVPAALGGLVGFLYHINAGYSATGDDPHRLDAILRDVRSGLPGFGDAMSGNSGSLSSNPDSNAQLSDDQAHVVAEQAEYYSGPVQVRTSFGTMLVSAIVGTMFYSFGAAFMAFAAWLSPSKKTAENIADQFSDRLNPFFGVDGVESALQVFASYGAGSLIIAFTMAIPFAFVIYCCHMIARMRDATSYTQYAVIGFVAPPVLGLLLFFVFFFVGVQMAFPCAIAMLFYRKHAGLEPKHVAEDIEVRDRRNLVGANHVRRKYGRVIATR